MLGSLSKVLDVVGMEHELKLLIVNSEEPLVSGHERLTQLNLAALLSHFFFVS